MPISLEGLTEQQRAYYACINKLGLEVAEQTLLSEVALNEFIRGAFARVFADVEPEAKIKACVIFSELFHILDQKQIKSFLLILQEVVRLKSLEVVPKRVIFVNLVETLRTKMMEPEQFLQEQAEDLLPILVSGRLDADEYVRFNAQESLSYFCRVRELRLRAEAAFNNTVSELIEAMVDPDELIRFRAIELLSEFRWLVPGRILPVLWGALHNESERIKRIALQTIETIMQLSGQHECNAVVTTSCTRKLVEQAFQFTATKIDGFSRAKVNKELKPGSGDTIVFILQPTHEYFKFTVVCLGETGKATIMRPVQRFVRGVIGVVDDFIDDLLGDVKLEITVQGNIRIIKLVAGVQYVFYTPLGIITEKQELLIDINAWMLCGFLNNESGRVQFNSLYVRPYRDKLAVYNASGTLQCTHELAILAANYIDNNDGFMNVERKATTRLVLRAHDIANIKGKIDGFNVNIKTKTLHCRGGIIFGDEQGFVDLVVDNLIGVMGSDLGGLATTKVRVKRCIIDETSRIGNKVITLIGTKVHYAGLLFGSQVKVQQLAEVERDEIKVVRKRRTLATRLAQAGVSNKSDPVIAARDYGKLVETEATIFDLGNFYGQEIQVNLPNIYEHGKIFGQRSLMVVLPEEHLRFGNEFAGNNKVGRSYRFSNSALFYSKACARLIGDPNLYLLQNSAFILGGAVTFTQEVNIGYRKDVDLAEKKQLVIKAFGAGLETGGVINLKAKFLVDSGNVSFYGASLKQDPDCTLGAQDDDSCFEFNVNSLELLGFLGPKGKFKVPRLLEKWRLNPELWCNNIELDLALILTAACQVLAIDLRRLNLRCLGRGARVPISFRENVILKYTSSLHFTNCSVEFADPTYANADFTKFCVTEGQLQAQADQIQVNHAILYGKLGVHINSTQETLTIGAENQRERGAQIRGGGGSFVSGKAIKSWHSHFDLEGNVLVKAPEPWVGYGCAYFNMGVTTLDVPCMEQAILMSDFVYSGEVATISALSESPIFISGEIDLVRAESFIKMVGGVIYASKINGGVVDPVKTENAAAMVRRLHGWRAHYKFKWEYSWRTESVTNYIGCFGTDKIEFTHQELVLPGHRRAREFIAREFSYALLGNLANLAVGLYRQWEPVLRINGGRLMNRALVSTIAGGDTVYQDLLGKYIMQPQVLVPRVEFTIGRGLGLATAKLRGFMPLRDEARRITVEFLLSIGRLPVGYRAEKLDFMELHKYLLENALELLESQEKRSEEESRALVSWQQVVDVKKITKPILIYMQGPYVHENGNQETIYIPQVIMPDNYRELFLEHGGGSLCAEILEIVGLPGSKLHITHKVHALIAALVHVSEALVETRTYKWNEVTHTTERRSGWFGGKTKTSTQIVECARVEQKASLTSGGSLEVVTEKLAQVGANVGGAYGKTNITALGEHKMEPAVEVGLQHYSSERRNFWGKKSVAGSVPVYNLIPSSLSGSEVTVDVGHANYTGAQIYATGGAVKVLIRLGASIKAALVTQPLAPRVTKHAGLLLVSSGSMQYGLASTFSALSKVEIFCAGSYESQGTRYKAGELIHIRGKEVHEFATILKHSYDSKSTGTTGLRVINQRLQMEYETAQPSRFTTGVHGAVVLEATAGDVKLEAPQVASQRLTVLATGNILLTPVRIKSMVNKLTHTYGLTGFGADELDAIMRHDFGEAAKAMLRSFPIFASLEELGRAEDWADRGAGGVKSGYYIYKLYDSLSQGKGLGQALGEQVDTTIKIRIGTEDVCEKTLEVQLAWLGAQSIVMNAGKDVKLAGVGHNDVTEELRITGQRVEIAGAQRQHEFSSKSSGVSVGLEAIAKPKQARGVFVGMDWSKAEGESSKWLQTFFSNLKTLDINGKAVELHAAKLKAAHARVQADTLIIREAIDRVDSKSYGGKAGVVIGAKVTPSGELREGKVAGTSLGTVTGIEATHTALVEVKQLQMIGGILAVGREAVPLIVREASGAMVARYEVPVAADDDCGFSALGICRVKAKEATYKTIEDLVHMIIEGDEHLIDLIVPEIKAAFKTKSLPWQRGGEVRHDLGVFTELLSWYTEVGVAHSQAEVSRFEEELARYCKTPLVVIDFLEKKYLERRSWLSYVIGVTSTFDALAKINNLNLVIYKQTPRGIEVVHSYDSGKERTREILHMTYIGTGAANHFNILLKSPGEVHAEVISHQDVSCKTITREFNIGAGTFIDVGFKREATIDQAIATIAGMALYAGSSSAPNSDLSQARTSQSSRSHVRGVVPKEAVVAAYDHLTAKAQLAEQQAAQRVQLLDDSGEEVKQEERPIKASKALVSSKRRVVDIPQELFNENDPRWEQQAKHFLKEKIKAYWETKDIHVSDLMLERQIDAYFTRVIYMGNGDLRIGLQRLGDRYQQSQVMPVIAPAIPYAVYGLLTALGIIGVSIVQKGCEQKEGSSASRPLLFSKQEPKQIEEQPTERVSKGVPQHQPKRPPKKPLQGKGFEGVILKYYTKSNRWRGHTADGKILEWDSMHGELELYDKTGKNHLGGYDPDTGKQISKQVPHRTTPK